MKSSIWGKLVLDRDPEQCQGAIEVGTPAEETAKQEAGVWGK